MVGFLFFHLKLRYTMRSMATPGNTPDKITYFAETDYRSKRIKFGIRDEDRGRHMYIIGKTGMGKSTLLENLAIQDIQNGEGVCFIDPHGGTAETLLSYVPEHRIKDVVYLAPFDQEYPVALNVLEDIGKDKRQLVASGLMGAFKKVWVDAWSARMEYILGNELLALLEFPGSTLLGVNRMLADKSYREMIVKNVTDPSVRAFWVDEFAKYSDKFATEASAAIQNKVGQFSANPLIRNMIGQPVSTFDIRKLMDERKIFIVNLSKGRLGESNANLIGSMLITKIYLAAMSRADVGPEAVKDLPPFYLYVDEFQSFANESFADILSEARKYKLSLTIAHQYIEQMSDEVRAAVFGNVGTMISFRVGSYDAEVLEKEFAPAFISEDIVNLGFAQIYLKLMIKGVGSAPFSATTLPRPKMASKTFTNEVIDASRAQFARPRAEVEEEIKKWHEPIAAAPRDPNAPPIPETRKYPPGARPMRPVGASAPYTGGATIVTREVLTPNVPNPSLSDALQKIAASPRVPVAPPLPIPTPIKAPVVTPVAEVRIQPPTVPERTIEASAPVTREHHQPFAQVFAKTDPKAGSLAAPRSTPPPLEKLHQADTRKQEARTPSAIHPSTPPKMGTNAASLSTLKANPKKDKGPSAENLSSLRAALEASLAKKESAAEEKKPANKQNEVIPVRTTTPQTQVQKPLSLLDEPERASAPKEVPEDVLRGLFADE